MMLTICINVNPENLTDTTLVQKGLCSSYMTLLHVLLTLYIFRKRHFLS